MEIRSDGIRAFPAGPVRQVGPDHMVENRNVRVTQGLSRLAGRRYPAGVATDPGVGTEDPELQVESGMLAGRL